MNVCKNVVKNKRDITARSTPLHVAMLSPFYLYNI